MEKSLMLIKPDDFCVSKRIFVMLQQMLQNLCDFVCKDRLKIVHTNMEGFC